MTQKNEDTMGKRIEEKIRSLVLAATSGDTWQPSHTYEKGDRIEPFPANGRVYECTTAGTTARGRPRWPVSEDATVADGGVIWQDCGLSLTALKVMYRGEPGFVPTRLYPFAVVFLSTEQQAAGQDGYGRETGVIAFRYSGYVSCEQYFKDSETLEPDANREADIGSYREARELIQGCYLALEGWDPKRDVVWSADKKEQTVELFLDTIKNGIMGRTDNFSNRGSFDFHLYTARQTY
jgi:hypothetical protein